MIPTSVVGFRAPRKLTQSPLPALTREIARTHTRNHGRVSGIRADDVTGRTRVGRRARRRASDLSRKARGSHAVETGAAGGVIFGAGAESSPSRRYLGDLAKTLNAAAAPRQARKLVERLRAARAPSWPPAPQPAVLPTCRKCDEAIVDVKKMAGFSILVA